MSQFSLKIFFIFLAFNQLSHANKDPTLLNPILDLYEKFKPAMAQTDTIELDQWNKSLPTHTEMDEMNRLIKHIYPLDNYDQLNNSLLTTQFPELAKFMQLTILEKDFAVIHEPLESTPNYKFPRFFGFVILRAERSVASHRLHHSAAHFQTDGPVNEQASALFYSTAGKSLVVAGASRYAVLGKINSTCQKKNAIADAAHNTNLIFHIANAAMLEAAQQLAEVKKIPFNDTFIQWHGMANTSCVKSHVFISAGAPGTYKLYDNNTGLLVNKLKLEMNKIMGSNYAQTPKTDPTCKLAATNNVFGRLINGVHYGFECDVQAVEENIKGQFIHIEQKMAARENLTLWAGVFKTIREGDSGKGKPKDNPSLNNSTDHQAISVASILLFILLIFAI